MVEYGDTFLVWQADAMMWQVVYNCTSKCPHSEQLLHTATVTGKALTVDSKRSR